MKEGTKATEPDRRLAQAVASTKCVLLKFERTPRRGGALFFLEARIVAGDAPVPWGGGAPAGLAFLLRREGSNYYPPRQRRGGIRVESMSVEVRQRRPH